MADYPELSTAAASRIDTRPPSPFNDVFVGRAAEMAQLRGYVEKAREGCGGFIVINGEAGSGKSRLVEQLAKQVAGEGVCVIHEGFATPHSYDPYATFERIFEQLEGTAVRQAATTVNGSERPPWQTGDSDGFDAESLHALQHAKILIEQQLITAILQAAHKKPLMICLSDVHAAPLTAWQFLHYLSENIIDHKILLVIMLRQDGREYNAENVPAYADVLQRMNRQNLIEKVKLERFSEDDIRRLIYEALKRTDFDTGFIPMLHDISGGIPELVVNCLEALLERDIIYQQEGIWLNRSNLSTDTLISIISDEHGALKPSTALHDLVLPQKLLLAYASLFQGHIHNQVLAQIVDMPRHKLFKELVYLIQRKILITVDNDFHQFKRPIDRLYLQDEIPLSRKKAMHGEIAGALENSPRLTATEKAYLLAYHYRLAEDHVAAFGHLCAAGDIALRRFAFSEASEFYEQAIASREFAPESLTETDHINLLLKSAYAHRAVGYLEKGLEQYETALQLCGKGIKITLKHQVLLHKGLTHFQLNNWEEARGCLEKCLAAQYGRDTFIQIMANYGLGGVYIELCDYDQARQYYQDALKLARESGDEHLTAKVMSNFGVLESICENRIRAIALYSQSIPLFQKIGDQFGLARIYTNIGITYSHEHNWETANEFYGKSLRVADVIGLVPLKSITFLNRAAALVFLQRFDDAREYNQKALRLLKRLKDDLGLAEYYKIQGMIDREQGLLAEAGQQFQQALATFDTLQNKLGYAETEYELAMLAIAGKDIAKATRWFEKAISDFQALGLHKKVKTINDQLLALPEVATADGEGQK